MLSNHVHMHEKNKNTKMAHPAGVTIFCIVYSENLYWPIINGHRFVHDMDAYDISLKTTLATTMLIR